MLVTVTIPGATPFWLSSPPCDDEDAPTKVAQKNKSITKPHLKEEKDRTLQERLGPEFLLYLVGFSSPSFVIVMIEMVR